MAGNASPPRPQRPQPSPQENVEVADMPVPRMSPSLGRFAPAFVRVQAAIQPVIKARTNPAFKGDRPVTYADLASILEEALPILSANGFGLMQFPSTENSQLALMSMLIHESGEFVSATMPLLLQKADPQGEGSAISYGRRYAACAILGIRTIDDDGNEASGRPERSRPERDPRDYVPPATEQSKEQVLGWADATACKAAHDAVIAQIKALPPEADRSALNALRAYKGMPMSPDDLSTLASLVEKAKPSASHGDGPDPDPPGSQPEDAAPAPEALSASGGQPEGWDGLTCPWCEKPVTAQGSVILGGKSKDDPIVRYHKDCFKEKQAEENPAPEEQG